MKNISLKQICAIVVLVIVVLFAFFNWHSVEVNFLIFSVRMPALVLILVSLVIGIAIGWIFKRSDVRKIVEEARAEAEQRLK
ncbi:lipopolysaccharide assembly protein LapA domain-containing protein [Bifidobacterium crudilactis]|jgi:uncharacterized integral membrane protein|uniref:DUF1049 domain-containing protein n=1 Tax=Bifidobacterium crudilactis TaxID=327277 RepID=A0A971CZ34_9BIFI|nr:lipopolysaccharide assembly protein LapA domain-containing protein [Bifidobacterium crudilactis]MDN5972414.1 lipopolysaccharide assembly protein LapA domain-containing protein [Bifidobacterium crudilactis]MDN6000435.1 lipopolysaccharide assembly protein LapA domain-containing protein [Bifidobacterium crudilactis]MDN6209953.1 lipopolysaccharide assembly protein LapA domain-containing protein [Bifidobacterium crudilactis]MDN6234109.1 lipopolysaccharide assembly protein LapA domain-containing p